MTEKTITMALSEYEQITRDNQYMKRLKSAMQLEDGAYYIKKISPEEVETLEHKGFFGWKTQGDEGKFSLYIDKNPPQ